MDAGEGTWAEAVEALSATHPHRRGLIEAYPVRFEETMSGPIEGAVAVLRDLHEQSTPLYALTNWSAETFDVALRRFDFLALFDGIVVSGREGVAKPDPAIFSVLADRYRIEPAASVLVDDRQVNVDAAKRAGLHGLLYTDPDQLRAGLVSVGLLTEPAPRAGLPDSRVRGRPAP